MRHGCAVPVLLGDTFQVAQDTPLRVLHRRTGLTRAKTVYTMTTEWFGPRIFILDLETSAGMYVHAATCHNES
jgi:tRNA U54 and U55 pseudouridine synthase Pus10